ncbi:MAG: hypothetical protein M5U12_05030 [Verrucomicrobia bacterium]|nr:hypothetical protein [Verrucomicrobiota bacterium]
MDKDDIGRLEVAMNQSVLVQVAQGGSEGEGHFQALLERQVTAATQLSRERPGHISRVRPFASRGQPVESWLARAVGSDSGRPVPTVRGFPRVVRQLHHE